jgi:HK97 family phage portal protein
MALWDQIKYALAVAPQDHPPVQTRTVSTLYDFIQRTSAVRDRPYRLAAVADALSVPAIFRAVTLISNVVGSLSMRAFRNGAELDEDDRPRLIVRPNPFTTPREFFRETAWSMATYGEAWWWVAARDGDGSAQSLMPVHPREVTVDDNRADPRYPIITWRGQVRRNADMVQVKMTGETGALRGRGPLQMCGAAVSVSVEAQEWAANFFAEDGGIPSIVVKVASELSKEDADAFLTQWMNKAHNQPRIIDTGVESVDEFGVNQQGAQMLDSRNAQNGEAARMFGIPGPLLEYAISGQSLTYQNVGQEFAKFLRVCLLPDYLEPMEQAISDQLTRSTVSRFNTGALERADIKTLYSVATLGLKENVHDRAEARAIVGLAPSIENAAVPFSPPQAFPEPAQLQARNEPTVEEVRCKGQRAVYGRLQECGQLLGKLVPPYEVKCHRCKPLAAA